MDTEASERTIKPTLEIDVNLSTFRRLTMSKLTILTIEV